MSILNLFSDPKKAEIEAVALSEFNRVAQMIYNGQLHERVNLTQMTGSIQQIGSAVNRMLDAIVQPLSLIHI